MIGARGWTAARSLSCRGLVISVNTADLQRVGDHLVGPAGASLALVGFEQDTGMGQGTGRTSASTDQGMRYKGMTSGDRVCRLVRLSAASHPGAAALRGTLPGAVERLDFGLCVRCL
jgi:hypothetical protein